LSQQKLTIGAFLATARQEEVTTRRAVLDINVVNLGSKFSDKATGDDDDNVMISEPEFGVMARCLLHIRLYY
jgi:hypothetical protein